MRKSIALRLATKIRDTAILGVCYTVGLGLVVVVFAAPYIVKNNDE
jgi:hypothetical protein